MPARPIAALALLAALGLAACVSAPTYPQLEPSKRPRVEGPVIRGELTYRQRIALSPDSMAIVELRENAGNGPVVAEWRRTLAGMQVPIRFEMTYDPTRLAAGQTYALRAAIFSDGRPAWASEPQPITLAAGGGDVSAGTVMLAPYQPLAFASTLTCGGRTAQFGVGRRDGRDVPQLVVGERRWDLREVRAASGARYEAIDDPRTSLWNKGDRATIVIAGEAWPECEMRPAAAAVQPPVLKARGNEPFWLLEIGATLRLRTLDGTFEGAAPAEKIIDGVRRFEGTVLGRPIVVAVRAQRCADTMTGMPYPATVQVQFDGRSYRGCGGDPADLLIGREWVVEDIGGGMVDRSRATLSFAAGGRLSGRASCNSFTATYTLTGETLTVGKAATTMMACAPSLMQQEGRFLDILQNVRRFEVTENGALVLISGGVRIGPQAEARFAGERLHRRVRRQRDAGDLPDARQLRHREQPAQQPLADTLPLPGAAHHDGVFERPAVGPISRQRLRQLIRTAMADSNGRPPARFFSRATATISSSPAASVAASSALSRRTSKRTRRRSSPGSGPRCEKARS